MSAECVYCGAPATETDHIRPVSLGGDRKANLVPACKPCNRSKYSRLLTRWDKEKVQRAAAVSPLVAAELARQIEREPQRPFAYTYEAAEAIQVGLSTLQRWAADGIVRPAWRTPGGHAKWDIRDLREQLGIPQPDEEPER